MYKENLRNLTILLGYINIAISCDYYADVKSDYEEILNQILSWANYYLENHNFNIVTNEKSRELYLKIDNIREQKIFDKEEKNESFLSDEILIWYEILLKNINKERK